MVLRIILRWGWHLALLLDKSSGKSLVYYSRRVSSDSSRGSRWVPLWRGPQTVLQKERERGNKTGFQKELKKKRAKALKMEGKTVLHLV